MEKVRLEDIGTFYTGLSGKSKEDFSDGNALFVTYRNIYNNPVLNPNINDTVVVGKNEKQNEVLRGDILFTGSSETPEDAGMSSVVLHKPKEKMYLNSFCFGFRINDFNEVIPSYLGHLLRSPSIRAAISRTAFGVTRFNINKKKFAEIEIPLPPLAVQQEIVSVLDSFTSLIEKMKEEVALRKKQMKYFRKKLLTFDNIEGKSVEWMKMSEIFNMRNGYTPSKTNKKFWDGGTIPWFRMEDIRENGRKLSDSILHITMEGVKNGKLFPANSFILATTATIGEHALISVDSLANQRFTNLSIHKSLIDRLLINYIFHYMYIVDEWCKNNINVSGFASVDMTRFKKLLFPVPPLDQQHRIASTLDLFEAYITKMERLIELRQKQYEYYRDKLLAFE